MPIYFYVYFPFMGYCVECHEEMEDFPNMTILRDKSDFPGMCLITDICNRCANLNSRPKINEIKEDA